MRHWSPLSHLQRRQRHLDVVADEAENRKGAAAAVVVAVVVVGDGVDDVGLSRRSIRGKGG